MPIIGSRLDLDRCPHCQVHRPSLKNVWHGQTTNYLGQGAREWAVYVCAQCGGATLAAGEKYGATAREVYPASFEVHDAIPNPAQDYLAQALASLHAPAGAVMLAASSVDAMLKKKGYSEGSLYSRIEKATADHLITTEMATWAHEVRLDANDQRHADRAATMPTEADAQRVLDFAQALGMFLFVLPDRVTRGLTDATQDKTK